MVTSARQHLPERTDRELVTAAREGDAEAFGLLVRRHQKRVYRLAVNLLKSGAEAEDVTQDTFVRAYGALDRFDGRSEPFTWIYRICVNLSLNALRSRKTRRASSPDDPRIEALLVDNAPAGGSPQRSTADKQLGRALVEGIDELSDTLRTTLVLVCIDGLSHAEAGEVLGCPEGTVAWRVHEARKKLRGMLSERGFDDDDLEGKE
ncbi:MAG TPA: sigma-70 family RNA polymerase sigma factor [Polyangiaceae bacterium]|nr:sigma-70 family RNA polymerase sigma factor [Polyangiaceae bacterium]